MYADCPSRPNIPVNVLVSLEFLKAGHGWTDEQLYEQDQTHYAEDFAPFVKGHAGQYVYHLKREETDDHLQKIGTLMQRLLIELRPNYEAEPIYQVMERVFSEHFQVEQDTAQSKPNDQLSASSLQSPDDLEASYRNKRGQGYRGYTANITETCDPDNELQLVTNVQVAPNNVDDTQLLAEALPELKERTDLDTLYTDGGYGSPEMDKALAEEQIEEGKPTQITCPQGQKEHVQSSSQRKSFVAHFALEQCQACPYKEACPAKPGKRDPRWHLRFTQAQANVSQRRRRCQTHLQDGRNLRAGVEATVRQIKHPFPAGKLPVRGQFRVTCLVIGSAIMSNIHRIQRYTELKTRPSYDLSTEVKAKSTQSSNFCFTFMHYFHTFMDNLLPRNCELSC